MIIKFSPKDMIPTRSVIWLMLLTSTFILYMLRVNMSIILIAMVEPQTDNSSNVFVPECSMQISSNSSSIIAEHQTGLPDYGVRYDWDKKLQGYILGSYFWGVIITAIPGGIIAEKYGPTKMILISFLIAGGLTLLGPLAASWHPFALIVIRFLIGFVGGVVYPGLHCLLSRWAPPDERGKFIGALLGGSLGTVATWPLLGVIIEHFGWSWGFFSNGIIVLLWCIAWIFLVSDSPATHPRISDKERDYIINSLAGKVQQTKKMPPYKDMFLSIPFWSLVILHFGNMWGLFFLMTAGPIYLSSVLGFNLGHTGVLAALPYLARMVLGFVFGSVGDFIRRRNILTTTQTRKYFVLTSHVLPGLLLFSQTFTGCNAILAITLITLSLGINGSSTLTNLQNSQDLAPNFAGSIYGIINCIGSTTGFISPLIVGYLTAEHNGLQEWHYIFYIGSSIYIACGIVFFLFGSGEVQPWNNVQEEKPNTGLDNPGFEAQEAGVITQENTKI